MFITPGGNASWAIPASIAVDSGVYGEGLTTTVLPVIVEGRSLFAAIARGKFHGVIPTIAVLPSAHSGGQSCLVDHTTTTCAMPIARTANDSTGCVDNFVDCVLVFRDCLRFDVTDLAQVLAFAEKVETKINSSFDNNRLRDAFKAFDKDNSGSISREEFKEALINFTALEFEDHILDQILDEHDEDGDGTIDYYEFIAVIGRTGATSISTRKTTTVRAASSSSKMRTDGDVQGGVSFKPPTPEDEKPVSPQPVSRPSTPPAKPQAAEVRKLLKYIADKVEQKSRNVRVVFRNFDEDKSGSVDHDEFR
eukprot:SAG31_NODE_9403_length_1283_cov_1.249155_1_plen_307_part_10